MARPLYDLLLVAHVAVALVGFGAIAAGGWAAASASRSREPVSDEGARRFFKAGTDWPARAIFLVPVLGLGLLFGGDRGDAHALWPWIGLCLWVIATGVATAVCWPAERRAQEAFAALQRAAPQEDEALLRRFRQACRKMELATGAISVCFVAAVFVMILQP